MQCPSVPSAQSPAYHSLPRVKKLLENVWILQEAMQHQRSSSKVMGWDCGAVRPAGMHMPYQTQLGHVDIKCAPVKAGTLVMQVESACVGMGPSFCRARSQGRPQITLRAGRTSETLPLPRLCPMLALAEPTGRPTRKEKEGSQCFPRWSTSWHLSSLTSAPLALTGPSWLPASSLQLPAPRPLAGTASPAQAGLLRGPAPSGP